MALIELMGILSEAGIRHRCSSLYEGRLIVLPLSTKTCSNKKVSAASSCDPVTDAVDKPFPFAARL